MSETFYGHGEAEASLLREKAAGTLPHGLILAGPKGIGKATLAMRLAAELLGGGEGAKTRIAAGSHGDLLVISPLFDEKKGEYARDISVDQSRGIGKFLSLTPSESDWRVVIVDSACAMNANAANAMLKILEEPPPQALLVLIAHNPAALLPTIRSRCRMVKLRPLSADDFARALGGRFDEDQAAALAQLSNNAPGLAFELKEQGAIELYAQLLDLLATTQLDTLALHGFADRLFRDRPHANWRLLARLTLFLFERAARQAAGVISDPIAESEEAVLARLAALHSAHAWAVKWQQALEQFSLAENRHLDYKQVTIVFFHSIAERVASDKWQVTS